MINNARHQILRQRKKKLLPISSSKRYSKFVQNANANVHHSFARKNYYFNQKSFKLNIDFVNV